MVAALIGHTGFVGGNLGLQHPFDCCFNSANFREMAGERFDLLVCAGVSAAKWLANRDPEADWERIAALIDVLSRVEAESVVLISTIDVYPEPCCVDETTAIDPSRSMAYGRHRFRFESFVRERFPRTFVARLSALFGPGLKKNVLFDLLHGNALEAVHPESRFQWYDVGRLWRDIGRCVDLDIRLANLVNEPVSTSQILAEYFPGVRVGATAPPVAYDVRTRHAGLLGGNSGYLQGRSAVLGEIGAFVAAARRRDAA
jgi:hypothetical protein